MLVCFIQADKKVRANGSGNNFKCAARASDTTLQNNKSASCVCHVGFKGNGHVCTG